MAKEREIKGRMKAIANIQRITKTMQMIATARFQASQRAATESQPYTRKIAEMVAELAASCEGLRHPLLRQATGEGRRLLLVLTSNRGLCGGYNAALLRSAVAFIREHAAQGVDIEMVGKKGVAYARFTRMALAAVHQQFGDKPDYADVRDLADRYMSMFVDGACDSVHVAYTSFQSVARQTPAVLTLLPLQDPSAGAGPAGGGSDYDFSPSAQQLLERLLPVTVRTRLFQCFNEAVVGEHIARMVAMKNATDSATKMGRELTRRYNRARQTAITTELSEIIGGAAALQ